MTVPSKIEEIPDRAFEDYKQLKSITFAKDSNLQRIGRRAFWGCSGLRVVHFPESLKIIDEGCFANSGLIEVFIPNGLLKIGKLAFMNCQRLERVMTLK